MSGQFEFAEYVDPQSDEVWQMRKTLAVLEAKPVKDMKMLLEGWDS